ncbi:MAG: Wadjet anti-phage system protein JetA family protein [Anaerocolumna sp.]
MLHLFKTLPENFFKPLTSKYKSEYADCIQLIFNTFKPEISYGVNREIVVSVLEDYFSDDNVDMFVDESEQVITDARGKANEVIRVLKESGWIEYESAPNHQIDVVLFEYAVPVIDAFNIIIREDETEYQGIISQIHAALQNKDLYNKPYELILKGARENTDRLVSELKKLNASIKRHMDKQTNEMDASQILEHFFTYHQNIGSKAYLRMKTSENISYFRSAIIEKLEEILSTPTTLELVVKGYMEVEQVTDEDEAYDETLNLILDMKTAFYRLDDIIDEIDRKHSKYMKNAVMRAKFLLSTGSNMEGKMLKILSDLTEELNQEDNNGLFDDASEDLLNLFHIYPQRFVDMESFKAIPVTKKQDVVNEISQEGIMSQEDRALYKELLKEKNRIRFSRKNIDQYVMQVLGDRVLMKASSLPLNDKRDFIRLIYISLYGNNRANGYKVRRSVEKICVNGFEFPDYDIMKA